MACCGARLHMQQYTDFKEPLEPKFRTSYLVRVKHSIKLVQKYNNYLTNWGTKQWWSTWMTNHGRVGKRGHFSVITSGINGESKKFLVSLGYLSYPPFLRLLEAAEREFGFEQQGVLVIPCEASELQNILLHVEDTYSGM